MVEHLNLLAVVHKVFISNLFSYLSMSELNSLTLHLCQLDCDLSRQDRPIQIQLQSSQKIEN